MEKPTHLHGMDPTRLQLIEAIRSWTLSSLDIPLDLDDGHPEDRRKVRVELEVQEAQWRAIHRMMEQEVSHQIATIRCRRNALLAPFSQLPTEIVCHIFEYVVETKGPLSAVMLSRVSSRWRSIAVAYPRLWTQIDTSLAIPVPLFLTRSGKLPLDIRMSCKRDMFLPMIVSHIERCRTVEISEISPGDLEVLCSRLSIPAPLLRSLSLESHRFGSMISQDTGPTIEFFGGKIPLLNTLKLESFNLPPRAFSMLSGITSLTLGFGRDGFGYRPSLERFLAMLNACPLLQELIIHRHGPSMDLWPIVHAPVNLVHMREVFLQALPPSQCAFLSLLALPSSAVLKIGIDLSEHEDILPILQIITSGRTRHSLRNLFNVSEITFIGGGPEIAQRWALHIWTQGGNLALAFIFLCAGSRTNNERLFDEIARELSKLQPRRLGFSQVNATQVSSCEAFCAVLSRLPTLTDIAISQCEPFTHEILRYLTYSPSAEQALVTPLLRLLSVTDSDVEGEELLSLIAARTGTLRHLKLTDCDNLDRKIVATLRTKLSVDWDDDDGWYSDSAEWGSEEFFSGEE